MSQLQAATSLLRRQFPGSFPMVRWIAFDDETAEAVVSRLRRGAAEIQHNTPVDAALHAQGPSVIVLPSSTPGRLLVARFTKCKASEPAADFKAPARIAPVAPKKQAASVKKPWWRKFVA